MAKHVNSSNKLRKIVMRRNFEALYKSRENAGTEYTEQDMQHLNLIEPTAVLPNTHTAVPRIPRTHHVNKMINKNLDKFENEYQAFIAKLKAKKAEKTEENKIQEQLEAADTVDTVQEAITEPVEETQNEIIPETPIVETEETQTITEPVKKTRKSKKTVVVPLDTVAETPDNTKNQETIETAE